MQISKLDSTLVVVVSLITSAFTWSPTLMPGQTGDLKSKLFSQAASRKSQKQETDAERYSRMCAHLMTTSSTELYEQCVADLRLKDYHPGPRHEIDTSQVDVDH